MQRLGQYPATVDDQVKRVVDVLRSGGVLSAQSAWRIVAICERFGRFAADGLGAHALSAVSPEHAQRFVDARTSRGTPSVATRHLRRAALRLLFRTARELGFADGDPTLDLMLPKRSSLGARPLTDDEVALCRSAALHSLTGTRLSAAWALAEATARTGELPHIMIDDLDLAASLVWVHGSSRTEPRWGALSAWGATQLERRLRELPRADRSTLLVYGRAGSPESRQAASCQAIAATLTRAGLADEADLRPSSVATWAGARLFAESGRIDLVALALGVRSLDQAARLIGFDWRDGDRS